MTLFLKTVSVDEAIRVARSIAHPLPSEDVPLAGARDRVLAADVPADIDIPGFSRSTVDGYALKASDTIGASESMPALIRVSGRVGMGETAPMAIGPGTAAYVPTGGAIPEGADSVVMIEHTELLGGEVLVKRPVAGGENVMAQGEDFSAGELILPAGTVLSSREIGVLAAAGISLVPVFRRPKIGIISTGNELVPVTEVPAGAQVRDINSYLAGAFLESRGCIPVFFGIARDEREVLGERLDAALSGCDAVIMSGGSSKDERDLTADLIGERGEVLVHGISVAPGKPTIIGRIGGKPVVGLPGHPASAYVILLVIVQPLVAVMSSRKEQPLPSRTLRLAENIPSARGREDYVRVRIRDGRAYPEFGKSGLMNTLVRSDGLIRIPAGTEGIEVDTDVEVILW